MDSTLAATHLKCHEAVRSRLGTDTPPTPRIACVISTMITTRATRVAPPRRSIRTARAPASLVPVPSTFFRFFGFFSVFLTAHCVGQTAPAPSMLSNKKTSSSKGTPRGTSHRVGWASPPNASAGQRDPSCVRASSSQRGASVRVSPPPRQGRHRRVSAPSSIWPQYDVLSANVVFA